MKERVLYFKSQEVINISSDEEDEVICLDDIPPPAKKVNKIFKPQKYSKNIGSSVTVRILSKLKADQNPVLITSIQHLSKRILIQESEYFKCLFSGVWREPQKSIIDIEIPFTAEGGLFEEERDTVHNEKTASEKVDDDCNRITRDLEFGKIVEEFFNAFIHLKVTINEHNMFVFYSLAEYFMTINFQQKIEKFIISTLNPVHFEAQFEHIKKFSSSRFFENNLERIKARVASRFKEIYRNKDVGGKSIYSSYFDHWYGNSEFFYEMKSATHLIQSDRDKILKFLKKEYVPSIAKEEIRLSIEKLPGRLPIYYDKSCNPLETYMEKVFILCQNGCIELHTRYLSEMIQSF